MIVADQAADPVVPLFITSVVLAALSFALLRLVGGYAAVLRARLGRQAFPDGRHVRRDQRAEWRSLVGTAKVHFYGATVMTLLAVVTGLILIVRAI